MGFFPLHPGILLIAYEAKEVVSMKILIPAILVISAFTNLVYSQEVSVALTGGSGVTGDVVSSSVSLDSTVVVQGWSQEDQLTPVFYFFADGLEVVGDGGA